ncbi:MAG: SGNH/GDSL hydrolase family protein [Bacteroidales bacterium]|nr:SGNH/GDSL hydrolase family protein [Bacteroidales bacterium]
MFKKYLLLVALALLPSVLLAQQTFVHPWQGAWVAFFGDSITDSRVVPGTSREIPRDHDWTGIQDNHYWGYLQEWLGIHPLVYGVNGRQWDNIPEQAKNLNAEHGDNFDAITIFIGTNDYNAGIPLGEWYDKTTEKVIAARGHEPAEIMMVKRSPSMDGNTLRGRINIAISTLKQLFPEKQIVILTPVHRAYAKFGEKNIQPAECYPNRLGLYISDYVEAIKETANVWSIPVIDLNALCGLNPMIEEHVQYFANPETDRLHPSTKGHERIAKTLMYQLLTLPCRL